MSERPDYEALAARVEAATEASRELDALATIALVDFSRYRLSENSVLTVTPIFGRTDCFIDVCSTCVHWTEEALRFTSDPAAPLRLIEQRWPDKEWGVGKIRLGLELQYTASIGTDDLSATGCNPACALTAAALRLAARSDGHAR